MTQQYLIGELSDLLGQLQPAAGERTAGAEAVAGLRIEVEQAGLCALVEVVEHALVLADDLCWEALDCGDAAAFSTRARTAARLSEFGTCAGLLRP